MAQDEEKEQQQNAGGAGARLPTLLEWRCRATDTLGLSSSRLRVLSTRT